MTNGLVSTCRRDEANSASKPQGHLSHVGQLTLLLQFTSWKFGIPKGTFLTGFRLFQPHLAHPVANPLKPKLREISEACRVAPPLLACHWTFQEAQAATSPSAASGRSGFGQNKTSSGNASSRHRAIPNRFMDFWPGEVLETARLWCFQSVDLQ